MQAPGYLKLDHEPISNFPTKVRYTEHFPIVYEYITQQNEAVHENDVQGTSCISIDFVPRYKFADTYSEQTVHTPSCTLHSKPSPSMKYTNSVEAEPVSTGMTILFEIQQDSFLLHNHTF